MRLDKQITRLFKTELSNLCCALFEISIYLISNMQIPTQICSLYSPHSAQMDIVVSTHLDWE